MEKIAAVILAAGKGTRMNEGQSSPIPKVMFEVLGKPIIRYAVDLSEHADVTRIVLVVGYKKEIIQEYFGDEVAYVVQEEQLGTGHAAMQAKDLLKGQTDAVMIYYGDHALYKPETVKNLISKYQAEKPTIAMLTVHFEDPKFWAFGRIARNKSGEIEAIVEQKDCTEEQLEIKESNPGFYIFNSEWLWENIDKLKTGNAQKEYYLTDMIGMAVEQGKKIISTEVSEESEVIGINTQEQLVEAEEALKSRAKVN